MCTNLTNLCDAQPSHFWWTQQQQRQRGSLIWSVKSRNTLRRSRGSGWVCVQAKKNSKKKEILKKKTKNSELKTFLGPIHPVLTPDRRWPGLSMLLSMPDHTNPYSNIHVVWLAPSRAPLSAPLSPLSFTLKLPLCPSLCSALAN